MIEKTAGNIFEINFQNINFCYEMLLQRVACFEKDEILNRFTYISI